MSKQPIGEHLEAAKAALVEHPLEESQQQDLENVLKDLELQVAMPEPVDPAPFIELLRDWEARLETEHPVLAGVLSNVVRTLVDMGV